MNLQFRKAKDSEAPIFTQAGSKYSAIHAAMETVNPDEWLVVEGFTDINELRRTQSGYRGGSSNRKWGKRNLTPKCRAVIQGDKLELWIKLLPLK